MPGPAARIGDLTAHGGVITVGNPTVIIQGMPAARVADMHTCPMVTGVVPHVGGPIIPPCVPTVLVGSMPQATVGDMAICVGPPDVIIPPAAITVLVGTGGGGGGGGGGGAGGLAGVVGGIAGAILAVISPPYPRAVLQDDGSIVTEYQKGVIIKGDAEFQAKTVAALDEIASTPSGKLILADLADTGKTTTIVTTTGGNGISGTGHANRKSDGSKGNGSDTTVQFNPDRTKIGNQPWETRPPAVGLAHELIHGVHFQEGDRTVTPVQNDSKPNPANPGQPSMKEEEEVRTTGIPPYDSSEPYSENSLREEWDPKQPERMWY